jgi:DNA (cytosine-5)-methyltransferase 1
MKHGSLFSGIGGFDLAAEWMGWENIFHCEWNTFGQKVLKHYFPKSISYNDITKTDFTIHRGTIDILTGGFPCQPYSSAGKRLGKEDERHLWPSMLRAIREIQPRWIVGENVLGLVNWNGGMVFEEVQADLEAEGYEVQPYVLPAVSVNAPHRRDRVWFIAYSKSPGNRQQQRANSKKPNRQLAYNGKNGNVTNPNSNGQQRSNSQHEINPSKGGEYAQCDIKQMGRNVADTDLPGCKAKGEQSKSTTQNKRIEHLRSGWEQFPTQSPICTGNDGLPTKLDGITFPKWRNESIKAAGNAIVPQVALQIFKSIQQYEL